MYIIKTAFRYILSKEKGIRKTSVYIALGISLTLTSFLVILSLMATLRNGNLQEIRDIESYDLKIESSKLTLSDVSEIKGVEKAFYFKDYNVVFSKKESPYTVKSSADFVAGRVRAIDTSVYDEIDGIVFSDLSVITDSKTQADFNSTSFIPSYMLSATLYSFSNDYTEVMFFKEGKTKLLTPFNVKFKTYAKYRSEYLEFDRQTAFISLEDAKNLLNEKNFNIGVYCDGGYKNAKKIAGQIRKIDPECKITTFIDANKTLYSALMLENRMVYIFLLLLSVVVLMQLKSGTKRIIEIKRKDAGILRVLGLEQRQISMVFILYGFFLLLISEIVALILTLIICRNINAIFSAIDAVFSMFGNNLFLSSIAFSLSLSFKDVFATSFIVMILGIAFIVFGCKRVFKNDLMRVVLDVAY